MDLAKKLPSLKFSISRAAHMRDESIIDDYIPLILEQPAMDNPCFFLLWQSSTALVVCAYYFLNHVLRIKWWFVLGVGIITSMVAVYSQPYYLKDFLMRIRHQFLPMEAFNIRRDRASLSRCLL